jgi:DNA-binding protein HU-beta
MNKDQILNKISKDTGLTKSQAKVALNSFLQTIVQGLQKGEKISISGLGTFSVTKKAARIANNPHATVYKKVTVRNIANFKPSKTFQTQVGGGTDDTGPMKTKK